MQSPPASAEEPPAPPAGADDVPIEELPIVEGPRILEYVEADYPPEARAQELEGTVVLLVELDDAGAVSAVEVLEPAGHGFDEAA
ncbi:MAG: TonB family protein, partial [Nitrosomonas halophila]